MHPLRGLAYKWKCIKIRLNWECIDSPIKPFIKWRTKHLDNWLKLGLEEKINVTELVILKFWRLSLYLRWPASQVTFHHYSKVKCDLCVSKFMLTKKLLERRNVQLVHEKGWRFDTCGKQVFLMCGFPASSMILPSVFFFFI